MDDQGDILAADNLFQEPEGFYKEIPKGYKHEEYTLLDGTVLPVRLLIKDVLWSNYIWNAGRVVTELFETTPSLIHNKSLLELGCGAALPSIVAALLGASHVVATDYPDPIVLENLQHNLTAYRPVLNTRNSSAQLSGMGFLWGESPTEVLECLPKSEIPGFDIVVLADVSFNHSEHAKLARSVAATLKRHKDAVAYVYFTAYRPWLLDRDLALFDRLKEVGLVSEKVSSTIMKNLMFDVDLGDETIRRTVFGYHVQWDPSELSEDS